MTRTLLLTGTVAALLTTVIFAPVVATVVFAEGTKETKPNWTFTEEQLRLFQPPLDADAETMLDWACSLASPIPRDTEPWGGVDKYREHVQLMQIMVCRAILATDPPLELEQTAWRTLWFPYYLLCKKNPDEWLPKLKAVYNELVVLSRKKGEVLDEQTVLYLSTQREFLSNGDFLRDIVKRDKDFLAYGEELLNEVGKLMKKIHQFDNLERELYRIKNSVYQGMSAVDEKYEKLQADFKAEMKELVIQNEDRLQSPWWYELLLPEEPFDTPEKQAEAYRLIEKFQRLLDTNDETKRFDPEPTDSIGWLCCFQMELFASLVDLVEEDLAHLPRLQAYLEALEKKNDPVSDILYMGYECLWRVKLLDFCGNGGSNDDLTLIFDAMMKYLDVAPDNAYGGAGDWLSGVLLDSTPAFDKCTPEQRRLFTNRLEQVIAKMEVMEKAYKDAGKPMIQESYVEPLRNYLGFLRLPGTVVAFTGQTVEDKPFDAESLRGKIVLLDFWATTCGPCIAKMPALKEHYEALHSRGFEIVGISIDGEEDKEKLVEFIKSRQLPWIQLHDPKRELYNQLHGRGGIPYCCLLLDREGKVILLDARGEALIQKLAELFPAE